MQQSRDERLAMAFEAARNSALISGAPSDPENDAFKLHLGLMQSVLGCETKMLSHPVIYNMPLTKAEQVADWRDGIRAAVHGILPEPKHVKKLLAIWWRIVKRDVPKMCDKSPEEREEFVWRQHDFFVSLEPFGEANGRTGRLIYYMLLVALDMPIKIISAEKAKEYGERQREYRRDVFVPLMRERGYLA